MNNRIRFAFVSTLVLMLLMNPLLLAVGNPPPGRWEKVIDTKAGAGITVYTKDGAGQKCKFRSVDAQFLIGTDRNGNIVQIEKASIDKVALDVKGRNIKRGLLFGILGGAGVSAVLAFQSETDYLGVAIGYLTACGAATGTIIGAVTPGRETIYISKEAAREEARK